VFNPAGDLFVDLGDGAIVEDRVLADGSTLGRDFWNGRHKMPSLRNVALTKPYMHNGFFTTLREVVEFYNTRDIPGEWPAPEVNSNIIIRPPNRPDVTLGNLGLTDQEIDDIVAFLGTLSDN
jgi:cytochrome c peroxidase